MDVNDVADAVNVDEYKDDDLNVNGVDADVEVVVLAGDQCLQL